MPKLKDLKGQRFERLTVLERDCLSEKGKVRWICICDCGNHVSVLSRSLLGGMTQSCGCLQRETVKKTMYKHGRYKSRLYHVWDGMKSRCYRPNTSCYENYGGRGITVCNEWRNDFKAFYEWAIANGYDENAEHGECTLDRINVDGNYEPSNCRWVSEKVQANNTSRNRMITAFGQTKTLAQWSELTGIGYGALCWRLRSGYSPEEALTKKVRKHNGK